MGFLSDLTGTTGARLAGEARRDAQNRERIALGVLGTQYDRAEDYGIAGRDAWNPVARRGETFGAADPVLLSAYGIGDPNLARQAFRAGPGYDFSVEQGLDAAQRRANSTGGAAGGNILAELTRLGQGYANQEYNNWRQGLAGVSTMGQQNAQAGAAGQAGAWRDLSNLARDYGRDQVGIVQQTGQAVQGSMGNEAQARATGAANVAGLGMNIAKLAFSGLGGVGGYGGYSAGGGGAGNPLSTGSLFGF